MKHGGHPARWNYEFIEYYKKAMANSTIPDITNQLFHKIKYHGAFRDHFTPSLRHINHLIQIDGKPNLELTEPRCEIYKISLSFPPQSKK